jgi:hypothetical protein
VSCSGIVLSGGANSVPSALRPGVMAVRHRKAVGIDVANLCLSGKAHDG